MNKYILPQTPGPTLVFSATTTRKPLCNPVFSVIPKKCCESILIFFLSCPWESLHKQLPRMELKRDKTEVINDPLGQTHRPARTQSIFSIEICFGLLEKWGRTYVKIVITPSREDRM